MPREIRRTVETCVKKACRSMGFDVVRLKNVPDETLAGLRTRPIRTVIDCGANEGQFARFISRFFPRADVHCFEPLDQPFRTLTTWAATQAGRVVCKKVALGDQQGETTMHYHTEHSPSSSILTTTLHGESLLPQMQLQSGVRVPVSTLDKELEGIVDNLAPEILLKLDVQGYEDRVLRGATKLLKNVHACLLEVCLDELYVGQATFKDLVDYLDQHSLGYAGNIRQSYAADGRVMWLDALFTRRR